MELQTFLERYHLPLDPQQQAAVAATEGPVLLLAVPGSGKTATLIARLGYLLYGCGTAPQSILTTTYTVAATRELRDRFAAVFGPADAARLEFRTINGVCARIIRAYEQEGHTAFTLITEESRLNALLADIWHGIQQDYATEAELRAVRVQITRIKNQMLTEEELADLETDGSHGKIKLAPLYREYCRALRARRWMDYDDQMVYALAILRRSPAILQRIQRRYRYFCVDEAQDTSRIQHTILALLAGQSRNLFLVGDEDQSIYGFRAAWPQALLDFERDWPEARVLLMEHNYRSTPQIVAAADRFIRLNRQRRQKHMTASNPDGPAVAALPCASRAEQYRRLAALAAEASRSGQETAVLYRDNDSALPLIDLLARQGIPYRARGVDGLFFQSRIVRDVTDILHLAANPAGGEAFLRVYYKLGAGIARFQAEAAARSGMAVLPFLLRMELGHWTRQRVQDLQLQFRLLPRDTAAEAVERIVNEMGYGAYLEECQSDRGRLDILRVLAAQEPSPSALLARLSELQRLVREGSAGGGAFLLSTIHSAKGLEFDRVILADVVDGVLPQDPLIGQLATEEQLAALEEDRRLFYVGMTRARRELTVVTFPRYQLPSSFADCLFPPPPRPAQQVPRPAAQLPQATLPLGRPHRADIRFEALAKEYFAGARVLHSKYGPGMVTERDDDTVTIRFDEGSERSFLLTAALAARALRLEGL